MLYKTLCKITKQIVILGKHILLEYWLQFFVGHNGDYTTDL